MEVEDIIHPEALIVATREDLGALLTMVATSREVRGVLLTLVVVTEVSIYPLIMVEMAGKVGHLMMEATMVTLEAEDLLAATVMTHIILVEMVDKEVRSIVDTIAVILEVVAPLVTLNVGPMDHREVMGEVEGLIMVGIKIHEKGDPITILVQTLALKHQSYSLAYHLAIL